MTVTSEGPAQPREDQDAASGKNITAEPSMTTGTRFPGHAPVRRGPGDWRCRCGVPLRSTRRVGEDECYAFIPRTGRAAARGMMHFHRNNLWMTSPAVQAALAGTRGRRSR